MKKKFMSVALFAVLGTMAISCQKETIVEPQTNVAENVTVYTVTYSIDGVMHTSTLYSEEAYNAFVMQLMMLARDGQTVVLSNGSITGTSLAKEKLYFSTRIEAEATAWTIQKMKEGYTVTVSYDQSTGTYNCVAEK